MIRRPVVLLGASGYGGGEVLRLLLEHPGFEVRHAVSARGAGRPVSEVHRHLLGLTALVFEGQCGPEMFEACPDALVVSALPNSESAPALEALLESARPVHAGTSESGSSLAADSARGPRAVDLSADLRLASVQEHRVCYPETGAHEGLRARAVYGLPELSRESIVGASVVANPGCFATALALALAPLVRHGLEGFVAVSGCTGSSGSGARPSETAHHPSRHSDFRAYKLEGHAHVPEVKQVLGTPGLRLSFVPHSAPMTRGIFLTLQAPVESFRDGLPSRGALEECVHGEPFLRIRRDSPRVLDVVGTNYCDLHFSVRPDHLLVCAALDNLGKGMAGQAVQNLNLMAGYPEDLGLRRPSPFPI